MVPTSKYTLSSPRRRSQVPTASRPRRTRPSRTRPLRPLHRTQYGVAPNPSIENRNAAFIEGRSSSTHFQFLITTSAFASPSRLPQLHRGCVRLQPRKHHHHHQPPHLKSLYETLPLRRPVDLRRMHTHSGAFDRRRRGLLLPQNQLPYLHWTRRRRKSSKSELTRLRGVPSTTITLCVM